jgi:hypothetical protein
VPAIWLAGIILAWDLFVQNRPGEGTHLDVELPVDFGELSSSS